MDVINIRKRNLIIVWIASFCIAGSLTMILPFISLYIGSLGDFSNDYVQRWSGFVFGITFLTAFFFSPVWGRIGDRIGRKKILILLGTGVCLSIFLMGFVHSVHQLFILRLFMGLFSGFISMGQALIAAQTPKREAGKVLGTLQTGNVSGVLCGPLLGGVLADTFGFEYTFLITAIITGVATLTIIFGIKEMSIEDDAENADKKYSSKEVLRFIFTSPMILTVMIVSTMMQAANFAIQPLLSLYVNEIHGPENIALLSGAAFSATGLGNLVLTRQWGKLGDKIGYEKIMIVFCLICAIVYVPQAWAGEIWHLVVLRFLLGVFLGGILPSRTAFLRNNVPSSIQGEIFGYNMSFRFLGNVSGPFLGGLMAAHFGISSVFYFTGILFVMCSILLGIFYYKEQHKGKPVERTSTA